MHPADAIPFALLMLFFAAFLGGVVFMAFAARWHRLALERTPITSENFMSFVNLGARAQLEMCGHRPTLWLAIHQPDAAGVFNTLGLGDPQPGHWSDCSPGSGRMFVSVPVNGWTIVTGDGIPDPADDVDRSYQFLVRLSAALGHVQMFSSNAVMGDHAWARLESGRVIRAYAWSQGRTLWNQGHLTSAEQRLSVKCLDYGENTDATDWRLRERVMENLEKVSLLAARWSLDPAELESIPSNRISGATGFAGSIHS